MRLLWLCWVVVWMASVSLAAPLEVRLDPARVHDLRVEEKEPGVYALATTGTDPYVLTRPLSMEETDDERCVLAFEFFCPDGVDNLEVFFGSASESEQSVNFGALGKAETWQPVAVNLRALSGGRWKGVAKACRMDFGTKSGVLFQVRGLQLRAPSASERVSEGELAERTQRKVAEAGRLHEYLERGYASTIEEVVASSEEIMVRGRVAEAVDGFLGEVEMQEVGWNGVGLRVVEKLPGGPFTRVLPRRVDGRDRLFSRWGVVQKSTEGRLELASHLGYARPRFALGVEKEEVPQKSSFLMPRSKKGMGGVVRNAISAELQEMGVEHVTVNVDLGALFRVKPQEGVAAYGYEGREYGISQSALADLDATMRAFSPTSVVSAIVLVGFPQSTEERRVLTHPESGPPGIYAMPNLITEEGVAAYRAAIAFVAERYAGRERGLISHWILHNEVDQAATWTNMGDQPMGLFMDQYVRSMRVVYLTARQWNPRADVFISLTHHWMTPEGQYGRNYRTREMLERLVKYSKCEGDFEWGVAYHPYPESLFQSAAWADRGVNFTFETELITPKNVEVLDAYMHRAEMLFEGKTLRRVLLSEQGFHTGDYGETAQRVQAAALVYVWHKIRRLESIEAFHYHRWIDTSGEGGLLLGLRTLPWPGKPYGERKRAWGVYAALDTEREVEETEFAKAILGVSDFGEIPYRGAIGER